MSTQVSLAALTRGLAFEEANRLEEALASYQEAVALDSANGRAWRQIGNLFRRAGRLGDASECFERAISAGDDRPLNEFFLSAVGVGGVSPIAPPRFVEALFDQYSGRFNDHLQNQLEYRAPELLRDLISRGRSKPFVSMLDLGCGTGLSGAAFRMTASRLTGVDLSSRMLCRAKESGLYSKLVRSDLCRHLEVDPEVYDLVISCDVFIHVGDLRPLFSRIRRVLAPRGSFAFSTESCEAEIGYDLLPSLRYAHSEKYIRSLASDYGIKVEAVESCSVRLEDGLPVNGDLFHLIVM